MAVREAVGTGAAIPYRDTKEKVFGQASSVKSKKRLWEKLFPYLVYPALELQSRLNYANTEDFLFVPEDLSTKRHIYPETIALAGHIVGVSVLFVAAFSWLTGTSAAVIVSACVALFYLVLMAFKLRVVYESLRRRPLEVSARELAAIDERRLPPYTILVPLYKEADVMEQIIAAMTAIDYPRDKLQILITLERYDRETIEALERARPPRHIRPVLLPDVTPKTKPKALNVAFRKITGKYVVIYDAEIIPDPDQLKKACAIFERRPDIACLQTRLDHYNAEQNLVTKLFNAEFAFYYDLFLLGLQQFGYPMPLSGHSTHFRRDALEAIGAWDPYNVTEDCDVGIRLSRLGYRTEILDSMSKEEATSDVPSWIRQRSRWMKGFVQTSIVHLRHPLLFKRQIGGWAKLVAFLLTVPGTVALNICNVFYWLLLAGWLATHSALIQSFFPGPIFFISVTSFLLGNALFTYFNLVAAYGRGRYALVKYSLASPLYWLLLAAATLKGMLQLITKPHHWEKTKHGTHLKKAVPEEPAALGDEPATVNA
ncbi:MAG: glycosyltransferase [bacterium]|nr:glycosyltransferase [bacterium]MDZ4296121.1 glycosyltransferase [Patescibacteria group bacterium]